MTLNVKRWNFHVFAHKYDIIFAGDTIICGDHIAKLLDVTYTANLSFTKI